MSDPDPQAVDRVALAIATEFGYEWVFESASEDHYDADYWRHVARRALTAYKQAAS